MRYLILLLCACGPVYPDATCETYCGMVFVGGFARSAQYGPGYPQWNCHAFQVIEDGVILNFPKANDLRFERTCEALSGWKVRMDTLPSPYAGLTDCDLKLTTIDFHPPDASPLTHELAHAVQNCSPNPCAHPGIDDAHACWQENGISAVIDAALMYTSKELNK